MPEMYAVPKSDPIMIAWAEYKLTDEYANSFKWAEYKEHRDGSMWAAYIQGFKDGGKIMPIEYELLRHKQQKFRTCPKCGIIPFSSFLRGHVQRSKRNWLFKKREYCAVICLACGKIVGYESP